MNTVLIFVFLHNSTENQSKLCAQPTGEMKPRRELEGRGIARTAHERAQNGKTLKKYYCDDRRSRNWIEEKETEREEWENNKEIE